MAENATKTRAGVIPTLRYRDGAAAVDWLCRAFGFGGRSDSCRDPEGHVWNFGTYDPWADR